MRTVIEELYIYKDLYEEEEKQHLQLQAENARLQGELKEAREYIYDLFNQACRTKEGKYDHMCIYEADARYLIKHGIITEDELCRPL